MKDSDSTEILVQVVPQAEAGREIGWGTNVAEKLEGRMDDVRRAVESGSSAVASSVEGLPAPTGWRISEVSASFGVTLTAEAGALVSKAGGAATFEVAITFSRGTNAQ